MSEDLRADHVIILVGDLDAAVRDYRDLGFTVVLGGAHADAPTHNALIGLDDDSYLELIAFRRALTAPPRSAFEGLLLRWQGKGQGLVGFALVPGDIEAVIDRARGAGLSIRGPSPGGRQRPDGQQVAWQLAIPEAPELPFVCADVTPRSLRLPQAEARQHANGVSGLADLTVLVRDLDLSVARYCGLLAAETPAIRLNPSLDANEERFSLGQMTVALAAPTDDQSPLHDQLSRRGEGPYHLTLTTAKPAAAGLLDGSRTHGAEITLVTAGT